MASTFFGMEIGRRALSASQLALNVVGQNTANVGTPGYSRQVADLEETDPYGGPGTDVPAPGQLGTGVIVASVNRIRDQFVDTRLYAANADQAAANSLRGTLGQVEDAFGEPSATGISAQLTSLFSSFSDLSASPESGAVRATVLNNAQGLVSAFRTVSGALDKIASDLKSSVASKVAAANGITTQIADLNKQIGLAVQSGAHPNDLLDKRTALIGQLSSLVDVQVIDSKDPETNQPTGEVQINVGGFTVVRDGSATALPATVATNGQPGLVTADGVPIPLASGEISAIIKATSLVGSYRADLDTVASNLITSVNTLHSSGVGLDGVTGRNFFTGTGAGDIAVAPAITTSLDAIAAAGPPVPPATVAPGNGDVARSLAALSSQAVIGAQSLNQFYGAKVAGIGADSQQFQADATNQGKIVTQLQNQQSSVSGVNLDEELTKMLQYQRSYQAAARIINVQDDLVNRIVNGLGIGAATGA